MGQEMNENFNEAVAIVGLAGRFPKAANLDEFWQMLMRGEELVTVFTDAELIEAGIDPALIANPNYVKARAVLDNVEYFDADFFHYSPMEAEIIDPQQRLFLESGWQAMENAGYDPDRFPGSIGVYGGISMNTYLITQVLPSPGVLEKVGGYQLMLSNDKDFLTTRVSYKMNLKGPSLNIQTACSTSLVAVHLACQALLTYQCDMALAGGASVSTPRASGYLYQPGMILSPDGHCRPFDRRAQGIIPGEGVGVVVLKRLSEARRDHDTIHAIIRGTAVNNDGSMKVGYTAPGLDGQREAIMMAQAIAGINPRSITYVETHGTGTEIGDPIEIAALTKAFQAGTDQIGFCAIGSVKSNMGHLDAAAGIAGLIKTVLALKHGIIPPSINFESPNPQIQFESTPFYVNTQATAWNVDGKKRIAGVSSFGIGGTNSHVIVEQGDFPENQSSNISDQLILLSARTENALNIMTANLAAWMRQNSSTSLADIAYTLQVGRKEFSYRRMVVSDSISAAAAALETGNSPSLLTGQAGENESKVFFLFPGQGSQHAGMGRDLYEKKTVFREWVDRCSVGLTPHIGMDLRSVLYPEKEKESWAAQELLQTRLAQPALFTIEYAMARLFMSWGIQPAGMVGHSIGEYVAAVLSGVFSFDDALMLVAARGRLMQSLPPGSMLSVGLSENELTPYLSSDIAVAVINAPRLCVVSGAEHAIQRLQARLDGNGIACRRLQTSHAFHSPMMDPILDDFTAIVRKVNLSAPSIPYLSNLTGGWIRPEQAMDPAFWAKHLRSTVRFSQNLDLAMKIPGVVLLEVGPGQTLSTIARTHSQIAITQKMIPTMRHPLTVRSDRAQALEALGRLWLAGCVVNWEKVTSNPYAQRIALPTYPFDRKRFWINAGPFSMGGKDISGKAENIQLSRKESVKDWFYVPSWERAAFLFPPAEEEHTWLILEDGVGVGNALSSQLLDKGHDVVKVQPGAEFRQVHNRLFIIRPEMAADYQRLMHDLSRDHLFPDRIVHCWMLSAEDQHYSTEELLDLGFFSLVSLAQALSEVAPLNVNSPEGIRRMLVITNQSQDVFGYEAVDALKSCMIGPAQVIPHEIPDLVCRYVDIVLPRKELTQTVESLLNEIEFSAPEPIVAYRSNQRWIRSYVPQPVISKPDFQRLRRHGVYLITGGLGGIGLAIAEFLGREYSAKLVLTSRSGLPDRLGWVSWLKTHAESDSTSKRILAVQRIEAAGGVVAIAHADVTDENQMARVIAEIAMQFGPINGVIHAAGIAGGGIISLKTREDALNVLLPKIKGALVLADLLKEKSLDFLLMLSSINALIGVAGQADYSAANIFLDTFALELRQSLPNLHAVSMNWPAWRETGMAVDNVVPANLQKIKDENLRNGLLTVDGLEALRHGIEMDLPQIIINPSDLRQWAARSQIPAVDHAFMINQISSNSDLGSSAKSTSGNRPPLSSSYTAPRTDIEEKVIDIWQHMLGVAPIGVFDNFLELGGHSLLATQILSRIKDVFSISLSFRDFFERKTVAEIAGRIEQLLWTDLNKAVSSSDDLGDREEIEI